jgi:hypothetical protein
VSLKTTTILGMFAAAVHLIEKTPELFEKVASQGSATHTATTAVAAWGGLATGLLPLAVIGPAMVEVAAKRYEGRAEPEALLELFRESLLDALLQCKPALLDRPEVTASDKAILDLWFDGLDQSTRTPGFWRQLLEDTVPNATVRMLSVDPADATSWWPTLRVVLTRWTSLLLAHLPAGSLGLNVRETTLDLSVWTEAFLRVNLTGLFFREFSARLTSGNQEPAFRQASLALSADLANSVAAIRDACTPAEPLKTLAEYPTADSIKRDTQLLNAQYRAFPYIGREDQIAKLLAWLDGPEPASFYVIAGGAGDGKTRLGFQLLERLANQRSQVWCAGWLGSRRAEDALRNERFRKWRGTQPTLIIIDYAASFTEILRDNVVRELAEEQISAAQDLPPLRILLLEREADENRGWYNALRREARDRAPDLFPNPVLRLPQLGNEQRRLLFANVLDSAYNLAARQKDAARPVIEVPEAGRFSGDNFRHPLAVCMAALVAYQRGNLTSLDLNRLDLAREIANHEYGRVERVARTAGKPPFLLLHMAAYITCTGGLTEDQLRNACREERMNTEPDSPWSVPELQAAITTLVLPPEDNRFAAEPIQPDIVGEAFIVRVLRHDVAHIPAETLQRAFAMRPRNTTRTLVRMIQDFAPLPGGPAGTVEAEADKNWALSLMTALLPAKGVGIRDEDFWEVAESLAMNTTEMSEVYRDFYRAVHTSRGSDDEVGVEALAQDCFFSVTLGDLVPACEGLTRVTNARRAMAGTDRARIANLANSLWMLSDCQDRLKLHKEALESAAESSRLLLDLAKEMPASMDLECMISNALNKLAVIQVQMGQDEAAIESGAEALRLRRKLFLADQDRFRAVLAESLKEQAERQRRAGDYNQAAALIEEAIVLLRGLAEANPDSHLHSFSDALITQGRIQRDLDHAEAALANVTEGVKYVEALVKATHGKQRLQLLRDLANALDDQAGLQRAVGDNPGCLRTLTTAIEHWRELLRADEPALRDLAISLSNQYRIQREIGKGVDAMKSIGEAVEHFRALEQSNPGTYIADLVRALNNQARIQFDLRLLPGGRESLAEAIGYCDNAAPGERDALILDRAGAISSLAACQHYSGQPELALVSGQEAIACYRAAGEILPDFATADFARALSNQALYQLAFGRRNEAIELAWDAMWQYNKIAPINPEKFGPELAQSLAFLGEIFLNGGQPKEAVPALHRALRLVASFQQIDPIAVKYASLYEQACGEAGIQPSPDLQDFLQWLKMARDVAGGASS